MERGVELVGKWVSWREGEEPGWSKEFGLLKSNET